MPRNAKCRRVCRMPAHCRFSPEGPAEREAVTLTVEEFEAIRLMDCLGGLSPLVCREAALFAAGSTDARVSALDVDAAARAVSCPSAAAATPCAQNPAVRAKAAAGAAPHTERKSNHEDRSHL